MRTFVNKNPKEVTEEEINRFRDFVCNNINNSPLNQLHKLDNFFTTILWRFGDAGEEMIKTFGDATMIKDHEKVSITGEEILNNLFNKPVNPIDFDMGNIYLRKAFIVSIKEGNPGHLEILLTSGVKLAITVRGSSAFYKDNWTEGDPVEQRMLALNPELVINKVKSFSVIPENKILT